METVTKKVELLPNTGEANDTKFVLGATGSGKTNLIANLVRECPRFFIYDVKEDYSPEFFGEDCYIVNQYSQVVSLMNQGANKIIFDASAIPFEEHEDELNRLLIFVYEFQTANKKNKELAPLTICVDELNIFIVGQTTCKGLQLCIQTGRGVRIKKVFGAQWFGTVPTWVRDSFTEIYAFAHFDAAGLARLDQFGFDTEAIKSLPDFTCIHGKKNKFKQVNLTPINPPRLQQTTQ